jgi:alkaline phosphatase D
MKHVRLLFFCTLAILRANGQEIFPVLGHVGLRNANMMVHANSVTDEMTLNVFDSLKKLVETKTAYINHNLGHTCFFQISQLNPNSNYTYTLSNSTFKSDTFSFHTQQLWQWRKDPPTFKIAFGSCTYINDTPFDRPGKAYGQSTYIFNSLLEDHPTAMIWGGDNVYFREGDWETAADMAARYTHTRTDLNIKKVLSTIPNYAVWDDHDFGPNDSNGSFQFKNESANVFRQMWPNQGYVLPSGPVYGKSSIHDVDIYFLDNRFFRTAKKNDSTSQMLGKAQIDWLINDLIASKATFKLIVVGSQILNTEAVFETYANHAEERTYLLNQLAQHQIKNVIFLSGDRHFSECSALEITKGNRIIDLTCSPLTSKPFTDVKEKNLNRIDQSLVTQQNYALLHFSGPLKNRVLQLELKDQEGKSLWSQSFQMN